MASCVQRVRVEDTVCTVTTHATVPTQRTVTQSPVSVLVQLDSLAVDVKSVSVFNVV